MAGTRIIRFRGLRSFGGLTNGCLGRGVSANCGHAVAHSGQLCAKGDMSACHFPLSVTNNEAQDVPPVEVSQTSVSGRRRIRIHFVCGALTNHKRAGHLSLTPERGYCSLLTGKVCRP
jgi:hypothetical protein